MSCVVNSFMSTYSSLITVCCFNHHGILFWMKPFDSFSHVTNLHIYYTHFSFLSQCIRVQSPLVADSSYELNFEIVELYYMHFFVKQLKGENHLSLSFVEAKTASNVTVRICRD